MKWLVLPLLLFAAGCHQHGACVWTPDKRNATVQHCRDDLSKARCLGDQKYVGLSTFTPHAKCPALGFPCLGNAVDAAWRQARPDGTCPPGTLR